MPNPIIQNYLNDSSIPMEKKKNAINDINSGVPDGDIVSKITANYGDIYTPKSRQDANGSEMSVTEFLQKQASDPAFQIGLPKPAKNTKQNISKLSSTNNGYDKSLKGRIFNAIQETGSAIKSGAGDIGAGIETLKGSYNQGKIASQAALDAKNKLKAGTIDKATYDKLIKKSNEILFDKSVGGTNLGISQAVKGAVHTGMSPITGAVAGGAKPELAKLGEKIASGVEGMSPENKEKLKGYMDKMSEMAKDHPALANYLTAGVELVGVGGGTKVASVGGKAAVDTIKNTAKAAAPMVGGVAELGGKLVKDLGTIGGGAVNLGVKGGKIGVEKIKGMSILGTKKLGKGDNIKNIISPVLSTKNYKEAALKGLATPSSSSFWTGVKPSKIQLSDELSQAAVTAEKHVKELGYNPSKVSAEEFPTIIDKALSTIGPKLRDAFKEIKVPISMKNILSNTWNTVKNSQLKKANLSHINVKSFQKEFENDYLSKIRQVWESKDGFRNTSLEDLWDIVISYDKDWSTAVKSMRDDVGDVAIAQRQVWLQNRKILRDAMDSLAENITDLDVKNAFKEMSDLYKAKTAAIDSLKPITTETSGVLQEGAKNTIKQALPYALGSSVLTAAALR